MLAHCSGRRARLLEKWLPEAEWPGRPKEAAQAGKIEKISGHANRIGMRGAFRERCRVGPDGEKQRPHLVVKFSRNPTALLVLQRDELAQEVSVIAT